MRDLVNVLLFVLLVLGLLLMSVEAHARCGHGQILRVSMGKCVDRNSALARELHHSVRADLRETDKEPRQHRRAATPARPGGDEAPQPAPERTRREAKLAPEPKPYQDRPPSLMPEIPYKLPGSLMSRVYAPKFELLR